MNGARNGKCNSFLISKNEYKGRTDSNSPGGPHVAASVATLRLRFLRVRSKG